MIYVVGPVNLQNQLMALYLEQATQIPSLAASSFADVPLTGHNGDGKGKIVLFDCHGDGVKECLQTAQVQRQGILKECILGLFNLRRDDGSEEDSLSSGIRGVFYQGDQIEQIARGVQAMMDGEMWISRKVMARHIINNIMNNGHSDEPSTEHLTGREREVLALIAMGAKNEEIAAKLFISRHTVKTHLYNIFKKLNTTNRLQAALWATRNL